MELSERRRLLLAGREDFNRGAFYEAHESWEDVWNEIDDPDRTYVQGLIQIATGLHKLQRERFEVAITLLTKALGKLDGSPDDFEGFDLGRLKRDARAVRDALVRRERPRAEELRVRLTV